VLLSEDKIAIKPEKIKTFGMNITVSDACGISKVNNCVNKCSLYNNQCPRDNSSLTSGLRSICVGCPYHGLGIFPISHCLAEVQFSANRNE